MSSLTPANIAASVAQATLQQSQTAKARDAARNQATYASVRLRQQEEKNLESIEDSYETSDEHLTVRDDQAGAQQQSPRKKKKKPSGEDSGEGESVEHIDIQA
ncbi:hypothetical protein HED60_21720 [Planctomycetales bacterium ZRK34]|nr:hypothetical protein HED60_21720 [Planctomycetales bacterium ZRK34]